MRETHISATLPTTAPTIGPKLLAPVALLVSFVLPILLDPDTELESGSLLVVDVVADVGYAVVDEGVASDEVLDGVERALADLVRGVGETVGGDGEGAGLEGGGGVVGLGGGSVVNAKYRSVLGPRPQAIYEKVRTSSLSDNKTVEQKGN